MSRGSRQSPPPDLTPASGDRTRYWPAIEARYGEPMSHWFDVMRPLAGASYADQMARLQDGAGFSRGRLR